MQDMFFEKFKKLKQKNNHIFNKVVKSHIQEREEAADLGIEKKQSSPISSPVEAVSETASEKAFVSMFDQEVKLQ